jgi:hypothetical protein
VSRDKGVGRGPSGGGGGSGSGSGSSAQHNWRGSKLQKVKVRGATNAVDSLARGEEVFTVLDFVTTDQLQLCGGRKREPSYSQNLN